MPKKAKANTPAHLKQTQAPSTRERVLYYRDGKWRLEWRDKT
jgi:hypothetical protein